MKINTPILFTLLAAPLTVSIITLIIVGSDSPITDVTRNHVWVICGFAILSNSNVFRKNDCLHSFILFLSGLGCAILTGMMLSPSAWFGVASIGWYLTCLFFIHLETNNPSENYKLEE